MSCICLRSICWLSVLFYLKVVVAHGVDSHPTFANMCMHCHLCVVQVREAGMSVSEKDNDGATPLHFASARGGRI